MSLLKLPPVLAPSGKPISLGLRLSLLLAVAIHLVPVPFLIPFPVSASLLPIAICLALAAGLLWVPTTLVPSFCVIHALVAAFFLVLAAREFGDRHGADLLMAGLGLPSLILAGLLGFAWSRLGPLREGGMRGRNPM